MACCLTAPSHYLKQCWLVIESVLCNPHKSNLLLTHWGRVTHKCVSILTSIGSDNGLSPGRRQAIIWTNAGILLIPSLETNFSEILSQIHIFSVKKMNLKMLSGKCLWFCLDLNVLNAHNSKMSLGITFSESLPHAPGAYELTTGIIDWQNFCIELGSRESFLNWTLPMHNLHSLVRYVQDRYESTMVQIMAFRQIDYKPLI